jgi:hypothetical protein
MRLVAWRDGHDPSLLDFVEESNSGAPELVVKPGGGGAGGVGGARWWAPPRLTPTVAP